MTSADTELWELALLLCVLTLVPIGFYLVAVRVKKLEEQDRQKGRYKNEKGDS